MVSIASSKELLDGRAAPVEIAELLRNAETAKLAVAFWGDGAIDKLALGRRGLSVEAICNLESGSCNPFEVRRLWQLKGVQLKTHPYLHAKVYWTRHAAVLGSSNASANGLVDGQQASGWAEANLLVREAEILEDIRKWFDRQYGAAREISENDLKLAEERWNRRPRTGPAPILTGDLMTAFRAAPNDPAWRQVKVSFVTEGFSKAGAREYQAAKRDPSFRRYYAYEYWHEEIRADDWILAFDKLGVPSFRFGGFFKSPSPKIESKRLTWLAWHPRLALEPFALLLLDRVTQNAMKRLAEERTAIRGQESIMLHFADVVRQLDERRA